MKKIIQKINTSLLEKHPTLWNTKIVWILLSSIVIHLLFYIAGYLTLTDETILHQRRALYSFLEHGTVFIGVIVSILQLVLWLIYLFKNNAFKNFYPTSRKTLTLHFLLYFLVFFVSTTYYYSYTFGIKQHVAMHYPDAEFEEDIEIANKAALFFSHNLESYTIDHLKYPSPLDTLYCERNVFQVNDTLPHFTFKGNKFQFYSLTKDEILYNDSESGRITYENSTHLFVKNTDSSNVYFYRDSVIDVSAYIKNPNPSYYNYSRIFFDRKAELTPYYSDQLYYQDEYGYYQDEMDYYLVAPDENFTTPRILQSKANQQLLAENDPVVIKNRLDALLMVADKFKIPHNLDTNTWFELIYHPRSFEVKNTIRTSKKLYDDYIHPGDEIAVNEFRTYGESLLTDYHLGSKKLYNVFYNLQDIKTENIFEVSIHIFLWISFLLAAVLFAFRVTNLKAILFAVISAGIIMTLVAVVSAFFSFLGSGFDLFIQYFLLVIATIIIGLPLFFMNRVSKIVQGVALSLSLVGFVPYLLLMISIISTHQRKYCNDTYNYNYTSNECFVLIKFFGENLSYVLLVIGLLFVFLYATVIKKWRALPEG